MKIYVTKDIQPVLKDLIHNIKSLEEYNTPNYSYKDNILTAPSREIELEMVMSIARLGLKVDAYPIWFEIPNVNIGDDIPSGVTFGTYQDESGDTINRQWSGTSLSYTGTTSTIRFWQPANNGDFNYNDVEIIQDTGFTVYGKGDYFIQVNENFSDTGITGYTAIQTIPFIDQNWAFGYFDIIHAYIVMTELYEAKGIDDNSRWAASTDEEKEILVRWNIVGLNKASTLLDPSWSEGRSFKEISKKYKEFESNMELAIIKRFNDWYRYLRTILSGAGTTKFKADWTWDLKHGYVENYLREFELGDVNTLIDWHDTVLSTYIDGDFTGSIPATTIVNNLRKVLTNKKYFI